MKPRLEKKYGLSTAICMVVGIVIGSGVFFKAETVLRATRGNMPLGILAWGLVGLIMIACAYVFALVAARHDQAGGLTDYAGAALGEWYAYDMGWFAATIYMPTLVSAVAWISARYLCVLLGWETTGGACMTIAGFLLCGDYAIHVLAPRAAGKLQVSATVIKLIPLALMAVVGTAAGLINGQIVRDFSSMHKETFTSAGQELMAACVAVAFAYEGWILATSIHGELKDAKRNLPRALVTGSLTVVVIYILYYMGLNGVVTPEELMASGEGGVKLAFSRVFGQAAGTGLFVLVLISCLGTLNGLMLACCRGFYALAARDQGPRPELFRQIDPVTGMPNNSAVAGLLFSALWLVYFYGAALHTPGWFGWFSFDSSEMPIVTLYAMYVPIFLHLMRQGKGLNGFQRFVMPSLALIGCGFMVYAAFAGYGSGVLAYLVVYAAFMAVGRCFYRRQAKEKNGRISP